MGRNRFIKLAVAIAVAAGTVPLSFSAHAQDTSIDRHLALDQALNYGRGISESALGGRLAWGESYYLDSYMTMYEATRNPFYLDKVVDHADRMIANASDQNSDGYLGWADHLYAHMQLKNEDLALQGAAEGSAEAVTNGSFEDDSDSDGIPDGWHRQGAANGAYRTDAAGASFEGMAAAVLESDGAGENRLVQTLNYFPNATYEAEAFMSVDDEASEPLIEVYNASTNKVLASVRAHHVGYERYLLTFKAPAAGNLQLRLSLQDYAHTGYKGYIDNVSVKPVHDIQVVPVANGDMETLDAADPTLPANWTRFAASNASNVYASTDSYSGAYSMAVTTDNTSWEAAEQVVDYVPARSYTLKFVGKVSSSAAYGRVQILNETDNVSLGNTVISYADWTTSSVTFTAPPVAGKVLKIRLLQNIWSVPGFTSYFDDLVMYESFPSTERVANPSFETVGGTDGTLPLNWTRTAGSTSAEVYGSSGINRYYTGTRGLALASSASGTVGIEQSVAYTPGETYVLSFRGRTTRPDAAGTVEIYNETATASLAAVAFSGTAWKKQSIVFTAPAASGQTLKLRALMPPTSTGEVGFVDVFSLKPLEYTEAAGWTRDAGTSLAAAHRSNDAVRFPADDAGLELVHDGTSDPIVYQEIYNYAPNARYGISFAGLASAGAAGEVRIYDRTASTVLGSWTFNNSDSFATAYESFMTPAADHELLLEVGIPSGAAGDTVWLDSFKLGQYWEQMVQEGIILTPILRFANAVKEDEELHAAYLTKAEQYTEFAADNMVHKWDPYWRQLTGTDGSDNGTGLYIMPPGFSTEVAPGRSLPHNQYLAYARMLYLLYDATEGDAAYAADRALYWSRANDMTRAFQGTVAAHPLNASMNTDAYLWHYWDPMGSWDEGHYFSYTLEDLSHAGLTMTGALEAYAHGQVFTRLDMERFSRTFTDIMWNQSLTEPVLSWQNSRAPSVTADKERMHQMSGWTQFIPFNPEVRDIADAVCEVNACMPTVAADLAKWSSNKLSNPGFESADADDPTLPDRWTRYLSTSATAGLTNSDSAIGDRSLSIASGSTWQIVEQRLAQYEPNTPYLIEFMGKRYGTTGFRAQVYDYTASTIVGQAYFNDTDWARHSFTVTMPEEGHDVRVRLYNLSVSPSGQSIAFDDVHARPLLALGEVANAGFETADRWDAALPRYWTRGSATPANNAVLDSSTRSAGRSSLKLVSAATGDSQRMSYLWRGYVPGAAYDVSFDGKVDGAAGGLLQIIDKTANAVLVSQSVSAASWTTMAATFTAPGAHDHVLEIVLTHSDPAQPGTFWADQIRVSAG